MATGDQTLINFPRESTMQEISQALQTMALTQAANMEIRSSKNGKTLQQIRNTIFRGSTHTLKTQSWRTEKSFQEHSWKHIIQPRSDYSLATAHSYAVRMDWQQGHII